MRNQEAALGAGGDLRRGSNIGKGQVAGADFFIVPDLANSNSNSGGNNLGAVAGAFGRRLGGFGALAGSISTKKSEAQALITLVDARSTEQLYVAEGTAQKTDISFGAGGGGGGWSGFAAAGRRRLFQHRHRQGGDGGLFQRLRRPRALHAARRADRRAGEPGGRHPGLCRSSSPS